MLTRSILNRPSLQVADADLDPSAIADAARTFATEDLPRAARRSPVMRPLETGAHLAAAVVQAASDQVPGRRRPSPWRFVAPALAIVAAGAIIAVTGWWMARGAAVWTARDSEGELDADALARATDEGMPDGTEPGLTGA